MGHRINIEQKRAKAAFEFAQVGNSVDNYSGIVRKAPMYILTNGFANFLAFAYQKTLAKPDKNKDWKLFYAHLLTWFKTEPQQIIQAKLPDTANFMQVIAGLEDTELRLVTFEALELLAWLRRFVKQEEN
jgi:CRISPR-associated protein Cmr5